MYTDLFVCEEGSVDQGFGLMINTLPFTDSNDKIIDKTKSIATYYGNETSMNNLKITAYTLS